jgi:hypothetical protein
MKKILLFTFLMVFPFSLALADKDEGDDNLPSGKPFQELQRQINELKEALGYDGGLLHNKRGFKLEAGERHAIDLPEDTHRAISIAVTLRFGDHRDTFFPSNAPGSLSNIMTAVVYRNPRNPHSDIGFSWIGTNNDGTSHAGTAPSDSDDRTVATIFYYDDEDEDLLPFSRLVTDGERLFIEHELDLEGTDFEEGRYLVTVW